MKLGKQKGDAAQFASSEHLHRMPSRWVDVKATDQLGRVFIVEIQIVVQSSFAKRAVFYACEAYTDQLRPGQGYGDLKATYSICLLMRNLWDDDQLHHQFRLVDRESGRVLEESIEIHTVELAKYNGL